MHALSKKILIVAGIIFAIAAISAMKTPGATSSYIGWAYMGSIAALLVGLLMNLLSNKNPEKDIKRKHMTFNGVGNTVSNVPPAPQTTDVLGETRVNNRKVNKDEFDSSLAGVAALMTTTNTSDTTSDATD